MTEPVPELPAPMEQQLLDEAYRAVERMGGLEAMRTVERVAALGAYLAMWLQQRSRSN